MSQSTALGGSISVPIQSDGKTDTWSYNNSNGSLLWNYGTSSNQLLANGDIAFHAYAGNVTDTASHSINGESNAGVELILDRDMGKLGKRFSWSLTAGFSIADIHSSLYASVPTHADVLTDTYDLFGQIPPAPRTHSPTAHQPDGPQFGGRGRRRDGSSTQTQSVTQEILIGNVAAQQDDRPNTDITRPTGTSSEGAYYTLRTGPTVTMPFGHHWKLNLSVGPADLHGHRVQRP